MEHRTTKRSACGGSPETPPHAPRRCAIYTRVSTDEQAALEYNSLHAQEEICKNYIAIRAVDPALARKWVHAGTYSDAGFSGGTLERPALKRLIADLSAGKIDVIVAYKIDRISRSIGQFYEVWKQLETHEVDFASATQEFNTATSQGKLMLNLLLSFAQYERELIGERTRDKIAAARRNGRWCGGKPILGYDIDQEKNRLVVNQAEASVVRDLFKIYLEEGSLLRALKVVNTRGYRTKQWTTSTGHTIGGQPFDKVTLNRVLLNPAYLGKVRHHDKLYEGQQAAIVDDSTFERVHRVLGDHHKPHPTGRVDYAYLLRGLLRCGPCNRAMSPTYATGRNKKYFYYLCTRATREGAGACGVRSVSAPAIEDALVEQLGPHLATRVSLVARMVSRAGERDPWQQPAVSPTSVRAALGRFNRLWEAIPPTGRERLVRLAVREVVLDQSDRARGRVTWRPFADGGDWKDGARQDGGDSDDQRDGPYFHEGDMSPVERLDAIAEILLDAMREVRRRRNRDKVRRCRARKRHQGQQANPEAASGSSRRGESDWE